MDEQQERLIANVGPLFRELTESEQGASLVEYVLLAVLIGIAASVGMTFLGRHVQEQSGLGNESEGCLNPESSC